eukprot:6341769-Prymnesium_polylepis.1
MVPATLAVGLLSGRCQVGCQATVRCCQIVKHCQGVRHCQALSALAVKARVKPPGLKPRQPAEGRGRPQKAAEGRRRPRTSARGRG